jgi:hypothetical protein
VDERELEPHRPIVLVDPHRAMVAGGGDTTASSTEPWWSGDATQLSLLEIAAAAGLPVAVVPHCGESVRREFERRRGKGSVPRKERRGERFPSRVYPAADAAWIEALLEEEHERRRRRHSGCAGANTPLAKRQTKRSRNQLCDGCGPASKRRKGSPPGATVLLGHRVRSAAGPQWSESEVLLLVEGVPDGQLDAVDDEQGCTIAFRLAKWGHGTALAALAERGVDLNARTTPEGRTPLHAAALQ